MGPMITPPVTVNPRQANQAIPRKSLISHHTCTTEALGLHVPSKLLQRRRLRRWQSGNFGFVLMNIWVRCLGKFVRFHSLFIVNLLARSHPPVSLAQHLYLRFFLLQFLHCNSVRVSDSPGGGRGLSVPPNFEGL